MHVNQIAKIAASVLYIEDPESIEISKSLFHVYGMSSLDFVDFAYELKAESNKNFDPDALWPINAMMNNPSYYMDGKWTEAGHAELVKVFEGFASVPTVGRTEELYSLFSVTYVEHRLRSL